MILKSELEKERKLHNANKGKLEEINGHVKGVVNQKEEDLDAYRNKVDELQ